MNSSVPTPNSGARRSSANGRILGLKKSTLSLITALTIGTPLLVACDNADAIPVNTEVTSTPAETSTEQTSTPATSKAPVVESTTSKAPEPEKTTTSTEPAPEPTTSEAKPTEEIPVSTTSKVPVSNPTTSKAPKPVPTTEEEPASSAKPAAPTEPSTTSEAPVKPPETSAVPEPMEPVEQVPAAYRSAIRSLEYFLSEDDGTSYQYIYDIMAMDVGIVHSPAATKYALDSRDIDWNQRAINQVENYIGEGGHSHSVTFYQLTERMRFTPEEASSALDSTDIDWNKEAIEQAQERIDGDNGVSKPALFSWLTSNSSTAKAIGSGGFTDDEAFYAIDNVDVNWNEEAVEAVNSDLELFSPISKERLHFMLSPSFTSNGFTRPQLDYAFGQLPEDTWKEQALREARLHTLNNAPTRNELVNFLAAQGYTPEEAEYAANKVGLQAAN